MGNLLQVSVGTLLIILLVLCLILFIMFRQNKIIQYLKGQQEAFQLNHEIMRARMETQEQTLITISREIHDNIGQVLSLARVNLNLIPSVEDEMVKEKLENTGSLIGQAIRDIRGISHRLVDDRVTKLGLRYAIENELDIIKSQGLYNIDLTVTGDCYPLEEQKEILVFRILQDALLNGLNQTTANDITVVVNYDPNMFSVSIRNKYPGFDRLFMGNGLERVQARTTMIGGLFSLNSSPEQGITISIDICTPITS